MLTRGRDARRVATPMALVALVALVALLALAAACSPTPEAEPGPTEEATGEETETEPVTEEVTDEATEEPETTDVAEETDAAVDTTDPTEEATDRTEDSQVLLEDGRHSVLLAELDGEARTITVDLIQFLTGQEAADAYAEDVPDDPDPGPPNDYWIRNESTELRTLPIAEDVAVTVIRLGEASGAEGEPWTLEDLPDHLAEQVGAPDGQLGWSPWWLTVEDGVVVAIEEQYLP